MKYFEIRSDLPKDDRVYGLIIYDEARDEYIAELPDDLEFKDAPMLLDTAIEKGRRTVGPFITGLWIKERVIPSNRQNLGLILKANGLEYYDEFQFLRLSDGRCAQDDFYLKAVSEKNLPIDLCDRFEKRIDDFIMLPPNKVLVFFNNGKTKICDLTKLESDIEWIKNVTSNERFFKTARLLCCGCGIGWDEERQIDSLDLYTIGRTIPVSKEVFVEFTAQRTVSSSEACEILGCSRQNISDLSKRNKIKPIKTFDNNNLFLKSEIEKRMRHRSLEDYIALSGKPLKASEEYDWGEPVESS